MLLFYEFQIIDDTDKGTHKYGTESKVTKLSSQFLKNYIRT